MSAVKLLTSLKVDSRHDDGYRNVPPSAEYWLV